MNKIKKEYKILIFIFILILIDQISKFIAFKNNDFIVINGVLKFKIFNDVSGCYGVNTNSTIMYILTNLIVAIIAFQFITSQNQFVDKKIKVFLSLIIFSSFLISNFFFLFNFMINHHYHLLRRSHILRRIYYYLSLLILPWL